MDCINLDYLIELQEVELHGVESQNNSLKIHKVL